MNARTKYRYECFVGRSALRRTVSVHGLQTARVVPFDTVNMCACEGLIIYSTKYPHPILRSLLSDAILTDR